MSILVRGKKCALCDLPIEEGDAVQRFGPFVSNEVDPLYRFSDASFHAACFANEPLAEAALQRYNDVEASRLAANRKSFVDGTSIDDLSDYLPLGYLTSDPNHPLYRYNLAHFRRSELKDWGGLGDLIEKLENAVASGDVRGRGVAWAIEILRSELGKRNGAEKGKGDISAS